MVKRPVTGMILSMKDSMSNTLLPLGQQTEGQLRVIAETLHGFACNPNFRHYIKQLNRPGVLRDYGGPVSRYMTAVTTAAELDRDDKQGIFVCSVAGETIGLAAIDPSPNLRRGTRTVAGLLQHGLSEPVAVNGPKITAWINPSAVDAANIHLSTALHELADPTGVAKRIHDAYRPPDQALAVRSYTFVPMDAPGWVRRAVLGAGFVPQPTSIGSYKDDGSGCLPPPSRLYLAPEHQLIAA